MSAEFRITKWNADQIRAQWRNAAIAGVNDTLAAAVVEAKQNHGWKNRTGTAERSIRAQPATARGSVVTGRWGSFDVNYFLFLELGTSRMAADYTLHRAADAHYPELLTHIARAL